MLSGVVIERVCESQLMGVLSLPTTKRITLKTKMVEAAARRAMELDPNLAESHFALTDTKWHSYDFDGWEKEMKLTIELKPNYAGGHFGLGLHHLLVGAFDEAEVEMRRARELDPTAPLTKYFFRVLLTVGRQFDRALEEAAEEVKLHDSLSKLSSLSASQC